MLSQEIKRRINTARNVLVGKVPDPKTQVEQITTALIYKFMDDMDLQAEELGGKPQFFVEELKEFSWRRLMSKELSGMKRWDLYTRALEAFSKSERIPELFRRIFKDAYLPYRDPETLNLFLKEINEFSYTNSENLGNAYEYLLSILGSQGDAGQFRTPRHIIDFIVEVVDPDKEDRILDPACGTAGFLISSYKHIIRKYSSNYKKEEYIPSFAENTADDVSGVEVQKNGGFKGDLLSPDDRIRLSRNIVGYDISPDMVRLSLVNLYLHGFSTPQIYEYDTLTYEERWDEHFSIILANPPFMTPKGGIRPHRRFQVQAKRSEVLFVDYIAEHLTVNGKAGIIVPEGIIFQSAKAYKLLRKNLVENWGLYAVVSLPPGVFQPYSGVKTSILLLDRAIAKRTDEILFVKVENDGFDLGAQRKKIDKNDLPEAYEILRKWQKGEKKESKLALWVKKEKLAENGEYNLTGDRYREVIDYSNVRWPMVKLGEVCEIFNGSTPSRKESKYWDSGTIPWFTIEDIKRQGRIITQTRQKITETALKETSVKLLPKNTVLICCTASVGEYAFTEIELATNQQFNGLVIKEEFKDKLLPKFLFFISSTFKKELIRLSGNTSFNFVSIKTLKQIKIPLPPLEVQKQIVDEIEEYQKVIDGARQVIENWKPRIKIDPNWLKVKLGEVCDVRDGTHDSPKYLQKGIPLITSKNLKDGKIDFKNVKYISIDDHKKISKRSAVDEGDILFAMIGTIGNPVIVRKKFDFSIKNVALFKFKDNDKLNNKYLKIILESKYTENNLMVKSRGGTQIFVSLADLRNFIIPLPPLEIQKQIVSEIEKEQKTIDQLKELIKTYEQKIKDKINEVWGIV